MACERLESGEKQVGRVVESRAAGSVADDANFESRTDPGLFTLESNYTAVRTSLLLYTLLEAGCGAWKGETASYPTRPHRSFVGNFEPQS